MGTLSEFSLSGMLPVSLKIPETWTQLNVTLSNGDFPSFTRYSADGGENWFMLYYGGEIEIDSANPVVYGLYGMCLLLDLSGTDWEDMTSIYVYAEAYTEEGKYVGETVSTPYVRLFSTQRARTPLVMGAGESLVLPLPEAWASCEQEITLERLGTYGYEFVNDGSIGMDIGSDAVLVWAETPLPQAGTYRLTIRYSYGGVSFAQSQITFFINYSGTT